MFKPSWVAPGPGVEKDAPPKKGPARYFEILLRDAGTLWKAGALFCLCCLPMAVCAAVLMLLGGHPAVFVAALAGYVWRSLPAGLLLAGAWAVMVLVLQPWFSLLLLCAGAPMLIVLWADFLLWPVMEKVFSITQHQREQRQAEADTDADGQSFP